MKGQTRIVSGVLVALLVAAVTPARADGPTEKALSSSDVAVRAKESFQRGVQLYEERDFSGAGVEFRRAYDLVPNFRILFNQGRVAVELHDYASALELFSRYLSEGGAQVLPERQREVGQELERLKTRVGQLTIAADESGAEVYLDEVFVGRAPVAALNVNVGRHRVELRTKQGRSELQVVDCPGQELVTVRFVRAAGQLAPAQPMQSSQTEIVRRRPQTGQSQHEGPGTPWLGWAATGLCAVGAAVFGIMAYRASNDLRDLRDTYPVSTDKLESKRRDTRVMSGIADGLLAGTAVLGGLSLYFSFDHGSRGPDAKAVASAWPSGINIIGHF
jgi:hypothetical protein